jgi:hypothetical protein
MLLAVSNTLTFTLTFTHTCMAHDTVVYHQQAVEQFFTDDGVPYWYDRRTGETFWERPLADEERLTVKKGGTVLVRTLMLLKHYL